MPDLQLGLIGDSIARSKSPLLHRLAGELTGLDVDYRRLVPKDLNKSFDEIFADCASGGFRGINITYPYKELAAGKVTIEDPLVRGIAAINTVLFEADGPKGYNTDHSGFMAAYRHVRGDAPVGSVCLIGAGGVAKAVAFGLVALGVEALRIVDLDMAKAERLAGSLQDMRPDLDVTAVPDARPAAADMSGLINCTPIGMVGHDGTPLPAEAMKGAEWVFDAVYTPVDTPFLRSAEAEGLAVVSGYELFFYQGVHAWDLFAARPLDHEKLRRRLAAEPTSHKDGARQAAT